MKCSDSSISEFVRRLQSLKGHDPSLWGELDMFLTQWLRLKEHGFGHIEVKMQHGKMNFVHYHESLTSD